MVDGPADVDFCIIGTGLTGLGMACRIQQLKLGTFVLLEKAADVGGTWRDNTYPGCACDDPSHLYSFSFAWWGWSRVYPGQQEIHSYIRQVCVLSTMSLNLTNRLSLVAWLVLSWLSTCTWHAVLCQYTCKSN
jgi:cation diffusion facilitator CzcD-associated flavoprotein CzcO